MLINNRSLLFDNILLFLLGSQSGGFILQLDTTPTSGIHSNSCRHRGESCLLLFFRIEGMSVRDQFGSCCCCCCSCCCNIYGGDGRINRNSSSSSSSDFSSNI